GEQHPLVEGHCRPTSKHRWLAFMGRFMGSNCLNRSVRVVSEVRTRTTVGLHRRRDRRSRQWNRLPSFEGARPDRDSGYKQGRTHTKLMPERPVHYGGAGCSTWQPGGRCVASPVTYPRCRFSGGYPSSSQRSGSTTSRSSAVTSAVVVIESGSPSASSTSSRWIGVSSVIRPLWSWRFRNTSRANRTPI